MNKAITPVMNRNGYPQFDKNHAGWEINVLIAIQSLTKPTAMAIADQIGTSNATVARIIDKLKHQRFVEIVSTENGYKIKKYGPFYGGKILKNYYSLFSQNAA